MNGKLATDRKIAIIKEETICIWLYLIFIDNKTHPGSALECLPGIRVVEHIAAAVPASMRTPVGHLFSLFSIENASYMCYR